MKYLIMCEGPNELEIIRMLLEHDKLIFTEDDLLNLVADPTEVTFTVKPVATTPGNPENPTDDGTTTPTQDGTMGGNPTTGDATPYVILAVTVAAAAGVMVVAFKRRKA